MERDPKQLYAKVIRGKISESTGIDSPYEAPNHPEIHLHADVQSVPEAVNQLLAYLDQSGALKGGYQALKISA